VTHDEIIVPMLANIRKRYADQSVVFNFDNEGHNDTSSIQVKNNNNFEILIETITPNETQKTIETKEETSSWNISIVCKKMY